jgi:hypothetical protein
LARIIIISNAVAVVSDIAVVRRRWSTDETDHAWLQTFRESIIIIACLLGSLVSLNDQRNVNATVDQMHTQEHAVRRAKPHELDGLAMRGWQYEQLALVR